MKGSPEHHSREIRDTINVCCKKSTMYLHEYNVVHLCDARNLSMILIDACMSESRILAQRKETAPIIHESVTMLCLTRLVAASWPSDYTS